MTAITVELGGRLNASTADDLATYRLIKQGKNGSFEGRDARVIKLRSAVYDAALDEVTLTPRKAFALSKPVQLSIGGLPPLDLKQ